MRDCIFTDIDMKEIRYMSDMIEQEKGLINKNKLTFEQSENKN